MFHSTFTTESFQFKGLSLSVPDHVSNESYQLLSRYFHILSPHDFQLQIIQPKAPGELIVTYTEHGELAGFCRTYQQSIQFRNRFITYYVAFTFFNPEFSIEASLENLGIKNAMQYKLGHPEEEVIYIALATHPLTYELISKVSDCQYPKPGEIIPEQILITFNEIKKRHQWLNQSTHPLLVDSPLLPYRSQASALHAQHSEPHDFFMQYNADFLQGRALAVYMPIDLIYFSTELKEPQKVDYNPLLNHSTPTALTGNRR